MMINTNKYHMKDNIKILLTGGSATTKLNPFCAEFVKRGSRLEISDCEKIKYPQIFGNESPNKSIKPLVW